MSSRSRYAESSTGCGAPWIRPASCSVFWSNGYVPVRNTSADSGLWVINGKRQAVYAKDKLSEQDRMNVVRKLVAGKPQPWQPA
jgi:hypothetical protein